MRVQAAPQVYRPEDRRQRFEERRASSERRQPDDQPRTRARHASHVWFQPIFGAHILGQITPELTSPETAALAYTQPEARTPRIPLLSQSA